MSSLYHYKTIHLIVCSLSFLIILSMPLQSVCQSKPFSLHIRHQTLAATLDTAGAITHIQISSCREVEQDTTLLTMNLVNMTLERMLDTLLKGRRLKYTKASETLFKIEPIANAGTGTNDAVGWEFNGTVTDDEGAPVIGASVEIGTHTGTKTDSRGKFSLKVDIPFVTYTISSIDCLPKNGTTSTQNSLQIKLDRKISTMSSVEVIPYLGPVSRRSYTGNVANAPVKQMNQPLVTNIGAALSGQVTGLLVTDLNGIAGSLFKIQLRGQSLLSIVPGNSSLPPCNPLFIVNGVPLVANNDPISLIQSAAGGPNAAPSLAGGISPLYFINVADIESIVVLKDADATAIYGSRGANGVIVITTRRGKEGPMKITIDRYSEWGKLMSPPKMFNTEQYFDMRREAFTNDGITPNATNAPDLFLFGNGFNNYQKLLAGNTSRIDGTQLYLHGGLGRITYQLTASERKETSVFSADMNTLRHYASGSLSYVSLKKKFNAVFSGVYSFSRFNLPTDDPWLGTYLVPNLPLYDSAGHRIQEYKNVSYTNPLLWSLNTYSSRIHTAVADIQLSHTLIQGLVLKLNMGGNLLLGREASVHPIAAQDPYLSPTGSSATATNRFTGFIVEPQAEGRFKLRHRSASIADITVLAGASLLDQFHKDSIINASGFTNDSALHLLREASLVVRDGINAQYRYSGIFGSVNANFYQQFIFNLSGRRDASSRFGSDSRTADFWAGGAAWIFYPGTNWRRESSGIMNFGKLRGSYGTTGNDQVGDYLYADTWSIQTGRPYGGITGLSPGRLSNASFGRQRTRKLDFGIEIELLKKIRAIVTAYMNKTDNQLVSYVLPAQTGFSQQDNRNVAATVVNKGIEAEVSAELYKNTVFQWLCTVKVTIPRNILSTFPNLSNSNYASTLVIGKSVSTQRGYEQDGVDPINGTARFRDLDGDGRLTPAGDYVICGNTDPKVYGSFFNSLKYKWLRLDFLVEGRQQLGYSQLASIYNTLPPGRIDDHLYGNQPVVVAGRWQKPGDITAFQKYTTLAKGPVGLADNYLKNSSLQLTDASFLRLRTITLSAQFSDSCLQKLGIGSFRIYIEGQNLLTITSYKGSDPVIQNFSVTGPVKTISCGLQITFNTKRHETYADNH